MRAAALALTLAAISAPAMAQDAPHYASARELAAKVATTRDGLVNFTLPTGPGGQVLIVRRDRTGEAEVHAAFADQFFVQAGKARVLVGGAISGDRETAPGERRGGRITGAASYDLGPGDTLWIPAGLPHLVVVPPGGDFTYFVAKIARP
jgi:mannose-6-phosphate isomerase-like protein (cupin superfamily)